MLFRNVLVAIDGSEASERALAIGVEIAQRSGGRLFVLGVKEPVPPFSDSAYWEWRNGHLQSAVQVAVQEAERLGIRVEGAMLAGYPAEVILDQGAARGCDLIVVGASDEREQPIGRTADKVVDLATCAVLVAR